VNNVYAEDEFNFPNYSGYVNDFENIIDNDDDLEIKLENLKQQTDCEVAVVTVSDFQNATF